MADARQQISRFQITESTWQPGLVEEQSLVNALLVEPTMFNQMVNMQGATQDTKFYLQYLLEGAGRIGPSVASGSSSYRWGVMGSLCRPLSIVANSDPAPNMNVGLGQSLFKVPLDADDFANGDIVRFECSEILARVFGDPVMVGASYVYTLQIVQGDQNVFITPQDLEVGRQVVKAGTAFEEYSKEGSSLMTFPFLMENNLTIHRYSTTTTGSAMSRVTKFTSRNAEGKEKFLWIDARDYQNMVRWQGDMEFWSWYGVNSHTPQGEVFLRGDNNRPVITGSGLIEQMSPYNTRYYNQLTENSLQDFLTNLQLNSMDSENTDMFLICGTGFLKEFDRAMQQALQSRAVTVTDDIYVTKKGNHLSFGGYYRKFTGLLGTTLNVLYNPMFDNPNRFTKRHPITGFTMESYKGFFVNFGSKAGVDNIHAVHAEGNGMSRQGLLWYTAGSTLPSGLSNSAADVGETGKVLKAQALRSSAIDGCATHFLSERGLCVRDPTTCGQMLPQVV